jgi:hypothetical protein
MALTAGSCVPAPAGLISWWRAEGNATDALNVNNGTLQGGTTFAAGEVGEAFSFNGTNSTVQISNSASLNFASNAPITIELWAYRTGGETTMYLIGKRNTNCGTAQYEMGFDPYRGLFFDSQSGSVATGIQIPMNTWMHLAGIYDGTNTFNFYTNGVLAAAGTGNLGPSNSAPLIIGNSSICGGFAGLIDEVSIYNTALAASAIQSIYAAGSAGKCYSPPTITVQPQSQTVLLGETVTFGVVATNGIPPYTYQWQMNESNISGATGTTLILTNVQTNQAGSYSVVVGGIGGSVVSQSAALAVKFPVAREVVVADQAGLLSALAGGRIVTFAVNGTIFLSQTVVISKNTTLDGTGYNITISGSNSVGVFLVNSGVTLTLKNLTVANGLGTPAGGGLYNSNGTVNILQCDFIANAAVGGTGVNGSNGFGGAIYNGGGNLNITNSYFSSNSATGGAIGSGGTFGGDSYGGAIGLNGGTLNVVISTFFGNSSVGGYGQTSASGNAFGGAIHNSGGMVVLDGNAFMSNSCSSGAVVAINASQGGVGGSSFGGAVSTTNGTVTVNSGSFYNNDAASPTVGPYPGGTIAGPAFGGAIYQASGTLTLIGATFGTNGALGGSAAYRNNTVANGFGGAIFNAGILDSTNCSFYANSVLGGSISYGSNGYGGAVYNQGNANLVGMTILGNQAVGGFGGTGYFNTPLQSGNGYGGGIFNSNFLVLLNSTLTQNAANGQSGISGNLPGNPSPAGNGYGGGIFNIGTCFATNDTLADNTSMGGSPEFGYPGGSGNGGGFFNQGGAATLDYLTICSNIAIGGSGSIQGIGVGGGINATNGSLLLLDSIVADNPSGGDFYGSFGAITDGGDNISSDISFQFSAPGSKNNTDPKIGALGNYGGQAPTFPLLAGSPAIDAAGAGGCPATDQRGFPRPYGSGCDIGAFEYAPSFSIQGDVQSFAPAGTITVSAGIWSTVTDSEGNYILTNVAAGTYTVIPSNSISGYSFNPTNQIVTVGPNATNINFVLSQRNALWIGGYSNRVVQLTFSGTNGQTEIVQVSTNLINWVSISTNVLGANGILAFPITNNAGPGEFVRTVTP